MTTGNVLSGERATANISISSRPAGQPASRPDWAIGDRGGNRSRLAASHERKPAGNMGLRRPGRLPEPFPHRRRRRLLLGGHFRQRQGFFQKPSYRTASAGYRPGNSFRPYLPAGRRRRNGRFRFQPVRAGRTLVIPLLSHIPPARPATGNPAPFSGTGPLAGHFAVQNLFPAMRSLPVPDHTI